MVLKNVQVKQFCYKIKKYNWFKENKINKYNAVKDLYLNDQLKLTK